MIAVWRNEFDFQGTASRPADAVSLWEAVWSKARTIAALV